MARPFSHDRYAVTRKRPADPKRVGGAQELCLESSTNGRQRHMVYSSGILNSFKAQTRKHYRARSSGVE